MHACSSAGVTDPAYARRVTASCFDFLQSHMHGVKCTDSAPTSGRGNATTTESWSDLYAFTVTREGGTVLACGPNLYAHMFTILAMSRWVALAGAETQSVVKCNCAES